ncbi:MAG: PorV/PorQ family protein [Bacteroidota bacterium]
MKKTIITIIILLAGGLHLEAQTKVGTSAAQFLGIPVGPRGAALGGAFVALSNDVSALYYNPGAISQPGVSQFLVSHTNWLVDTKFDWVGVMINLDGQSAIGVSITQLDYGEELITTEIDQIGTGETWSAADISVGLTYARNLTDRFSIGGTAKYIQQRIWNESASAFAVDVGLRYRTDFNGMIIGMSISNFGTDMRLDGKDLFRPIDTDPTNTGTNKTIVSRLKTDDWPLPLFFRAGLAMDVVKFEDIRITAAADALRPSDSAETLNVGGEFSWRESLFIRGGMNALFLPDRENGFTVGGGAKYELSAVNFVSFDYSYQDFGKFGGIQSFAIGITF